MWDKILIKYKLNNGELDVISGGATGSSQQTPGMKCPQCGEFIPTTIMQIITASSLVCPHCHLRLNIDRMKSGKAIEALKKGQHAQDALSRK